MARPRTKTRRPRRRWTEAERLQILRELKASGLSMRAFAAKHDLAETNLAKWKQRYPDKRLRRPKFVEVKPMAMGESACDFDYELRLAGGHTLLLRRGFDGREVGTLVTALAR